MPRKAVVFKIPSYLWDELGLDDVDKYHRVLCALYLHRGPQYLRDLVQRRPDDFEVQELLRVAPELGLTKRDSLAKK